MMEGSEGGGAFQQVIERPASLCATLAKTPFLSGLSYALCQMRGLSRNMICEQALRQDQTWP